MNYKQGSVRHNLALSGGYAEVLDNVMTVLANAAEYANEIDKNRANTAKERAERKMEEVNREDKEFMIAESALHRALIRMQVAAKSTGR